MGIFSCCLCANGPQKTSFHQYNLSSQPSLQEVLAQEEVIPAVQLENGGTPEPRASTETPEADESVPLQLAAGRLAKHLLERQPSKSKKSQRTSFGGVGGQRWVSNLDGATNENSTFNGGVGSTGLLLQEVKPLHDPVAGSSTSRLAGAYGSLTSQGNIHPGTSGGPQSSSMTFARSVNRLSAINTSGAFSRRASLLDVDFTKASAQLALGSSLLRGSIAGGFSTHGAPPEPWILHSILRQAAPTPTMASRGSAIHSVSHFVASGPLMHGGFTPSSMPATSSMMATIAAGLGQTPNAGRPMDERDNSRSSYGQFNACSPAATHAQHALHPPHSAYPVPLFSRAVCERVEGLQAPLVVLVLRWAGRKLSDCGGGAGDLAGAGAGASPLLFRGSRGVERQRSSALTDGAAPRNSILGTGDDGDDGSGWPLTEGPVVISMQLDMPPPQQIGAKRSTSVTARASQLSPPSQTGDAEVDARRRAYACLASTLEVAAGRQVALAHAWHNAAGGALLTAAASAAASPAPDAAAGAGGGRVGSESQQSQCDASDTSLSTAAAAAALAERGELGAVLWALRELFDQDPCLPLLARDLLRQAAIRPEHVPPLTHSLAPSAYSGLLGGRDLFSAAALTAAAAAVGGSTAVHSAASGTRRAVMGAAALQTAVSVGQVRVHVCAFQTAAGDVAASAVSTAKTMASAGSATNSLQSSWLPAIVLEWPQPPAATPPHSSTPIPVAITTQSAINNSMMLSPATRGSIGHSQVRSIFPEPERSPSAATVTLEGNILAPTPQGLATLGSVSVPRSFYVDPTASSGLTMHGVPSLAFGLASLTGNTAGGSTAIESVPALATVMASGDSGAGGFGSPASAAAIGNPMPAATLGLEALAGAELLYIMQTWQRHHLLLASVPYAITLFDCGGRVLQQNQGSVDFMGEITGDPMEQHQSIAATAAAAGVAPGIGLASELRTSAASGAKAGGEAPGKAGLSNGPGGGGGGGGFAASGSALMNISEVDVLSVLFCLCPDLLDEMLEEVICGNMWRGIVQVPRVMRPCIRAAQRWGAAGKIAVVQHGIGAMGAKAAAETAAVATGPVAAVATNGIGGGGVADGGRAAALGAGTMPSVAYAAAAAAAVPLEIDGAPLPITHQSSRSPSRDSHSKSINESISASDIAGGAAGADVCTDAGAAAGGMGDILQHTRSFNSGRPNVNVSSPLRRLATSLAFPTLASGNFPQLEKAGGSSGGDAPPGTQRPGPYRRPPARSYSLRALVRPAVNIISVNSKPGSSSQRAPATHRLAQGDSSGGTAVPAEQSLPDVPPPLLQRSNPAAHAQVRHSVAETKFLSFTAGQSNSPPLQSHASEQLVPMPGQQSPLSPFQSMRQPSGSTLQGQPQQMSSLLFKHAAAPASPAFAAAAKTRSSVLAFAERLRIGRTPSNESSRGDGDGGDPAGSSLSGAVRPCTRPAPRRLRSGLSLASGPDGPLPGLPANSFSAQYGMDLESQTEAEELGLPVSAADDDDDDEVMAVPTTAAEDSAAVAASAVGSRISAEEALREGKAAGRACSFLSTRGAISSEGPAGSSTHSARSSTAAQGDDGSTRPCGSSPSPSSTSPAAAATAALPLRSLGDQRQIRLMSDPAAHEVHPAAITIADPDNDGVELRVAAAAAADSAAIALAMAMSTMAAPPPMQLNGDGWGRAATTAARATTAMGLMSADQHNGGSTPDGKPPLGDMRPVHSVPIERLEGDPACCVASGAEDAGAHWPTVGDGWNHSANGDGRAVTGGAGGGHARGGVRRQMHALKRPLTRSSTRTYLLTAMSTSTLNVLGRVHSMRQMEYEEGPSLEGGEYGSTVEDGSGAGAGKLLRASTTTAGLGRRARNSAATSGIYRSKSLSLNVTAAEPRMAVPRIFSFMRSASKRMIQQMHEQQQHQQQGGHFSADGDGGAMMISPIRRRTFDLVPMDGGGGGGSGSGSGVAHRWSPRLSTEWPPPRVSPQTRLGLERLYTPGRPSGSGSMHTGDGGACKRHSGASDGLLLQKSSREQGVAPLPEAAAAAASAQPSSSSDGAGSNVGVGAGVAVAAAAQVATSSLDVVHEDESQDTPLLPPQLSRLRASEEWAGGGGAGGGVMRMVSPREMSPAEMARRVGSAWHEVAATSFTDPVTGARVVALVQNDVSEKVETEMQLTELMEVEHRLLEQIFPRHVLEHIAMQNISGATAQSAGGGGGGRKQRRMSQFDLLKSQDCSQLAHHHEQITVLFCDVKGFTAMCSSVEPAVVMSFLNTLYTQFDSLLHVHDVYKVETIGDCYMVAGGLVSRGPDGVASLLEGGEVDPDHARKVVHFAKDLLEVVREMRMPNAQPLQVRVGIHSGPAMSGVVGTKMPRFCLFGDTINTASRCESTCPPSSIHATTAVRDLVPEEPWVATGGVMAKGKGIMRTFLLGPRQTAARAPELADDGAVSDLCSIEPVEVGGGVGVGPRGGSFLSSPCPPGPGPGTIATAGAAAASSAAGPAAAAAQAAATAAGHSSAVTAATAGRYSALRRLGSGVRRNSSLRALTTTSAAVAAAAAAAAGGGGLPSSVSLVPPVSIAAAAIAAAGGSSGPSSPSNRQPSGPAVFSGLQQLPNNTNSGYLRLPSTVLSSSPAETVTSNALVRNFGPAGELPYISPLTDPAGAMAAAMAAATAVAAAATAAGAGSPIDPDGDSLTSATSMRVVNILATGQRLAGGTDADAVPRVGMIMPPPPTHGVLHREPPGGTVSLFAAPSTRTELGRDFLSSGAVVQASGLLFDSGIGVTATGPVLQAGALPPIVYEGAGEHEPQDLGENVRAPNK